MTSPIEGDTMMAAMGMVMTQPWDAGDLLLTFVMWAVMMVGMMAVPALPVLLLFAGVHAQRVDRGVVPAVPSFGLGYLIVWLGFSACATAAQWALHEAALLSSTMSTSSTSVAGVILITAPRPSGTERNEGWCGRQHDRPQLMRQSLGRAPAPVHASTGGVH